ncbi:MAG: hypothetical protein EZS28_005693 [Streblomastix strix]|uniref:Uncharacterized protein n=1 Tax=Streblomastix strix TaxID=222440 RepID=A0A5J4WV31_9EUKA|nr:MAG: hypothetical protein EZS28_005693 [Streblomastix strix]
MVQQTGNSETLHIQRLERVLVRRREKQQAKDNGKGLKRPRLDEQLFEAEKRKKLNSSSSSSSSSCQEIYEDWTGKGNNEIP